MQILAAVRRGQRAIHGPLEPFDRHRLRDAHTLTKEEDR